jgi:NAD(P)H-hydrate repair Nnr-like enzyme with NAD(P)H-hydrate dehydratase domain
MATAGTGDVLTGVVAALLAAGLAAFPAARLAAWVHGVAGDAAAADLGQISMTARDLLDRLSVGFRAAEVVE